MAPLVLELEQGSRRASQMSWRNYDTWYYGVGLTLIEERALNDATNPFIHTEQANCPECDVPMTQLFHHQNCKTWLERGHD